MPGQATSAHSSTSTGLILKTALISVASINQSLSFIRSQYIKPWHDSAISFVTSIGTHCAKPANAIISD
ncbi:hypothetical protein VI817_010536 [Penicillium citrinum]|nr:hypothetical protein VI817_010536 [Penicillium citrinum]